MNLKAVEGRGRGLIQGTILAGFEVLTAVSTKMAVFGATTQKRVIFVLSWHLHGGTEENQENP
jgi:hypothetical protein